MGDEDPWQALNQTFDDGTIPAIADQTVIQWGLGKKVGDVLLYQNELGDTLAIETDCRNNTIYFPGICNYFKPELSEKLSNEQRLIIFS